MKYSWILAALFPAFFVCWAQFDVGMYIYIGGVWTYVGLAVYLAREDL